MAFVLTMSLAGNVLKPVWLRQVACAAFILTLTGILEHCLLVPFFPWLWVACFSKLLCVLLLFRN